MFGQESHLQVGMDDANQKIKNENLFGGGGQASAHALVWVINKGIAFSEHDQNCFKSIIDKTMEETDGIYYFGYWWRMVGVANSKEEISLLSEYHYSWVFKW